jgi:hypothetical protein
MEMMWNKVWYRWWVFQDIEMLVPILGHFINIILVRLVGRSLQFPATLLVIEAGMYEACISDMYCPTLNGTDVYTFVLINTFIC